jgi:hypothetical protein
MSLTIKLPADAERALEAKARAQGVPVESYVRQLIEREVQGSGAAPDQESGNRPVAETIREIWSNVPDRVRAKLPEDGASQIDHYVYGTPKKDQ